MDVITLESWHPSQLFFLELPKELQIQIWKEAVQTPISPDILTGDDFSNNVIWTTHHLEQRLWGVRNAEADVDIPVFLEVIHTCRLSRLIVLEWRKYTIEQCPPTDAFDGWL